MHRHLQLQTEPIDEAALRGGTVIPPGCGAVVVFLGVVRGREAGREIGGLDYTAFEAMARHQFGLLFDELERRWPVESVRLVHRLGRVAVGEASLWVEVVGSHRAEVFAALPWLVDEMKRVVPIWKQDW